MMMIFDLILGYTDVVKGLVRMGLLSPNQHPALHAQVTIFLFSEI